MALQLARTTLATAKLSNFARFSHHAAHKFSNALKSGPLSNLTELDNGIRVATEKTNSASATIGVWVEGGSGCESQETNGVIHFLEHLLFKGSKSRSRKQLEKDINSLGAVLNSYTNREKSGFFVTLAPEDISKGLEILSDLVQNPALSPEEVESTRKNILKELDECQSNYEQVVLDYLHSVAYQQTPLAFSKFGPTENIQRFTRDDLERGLDLLFKGPRMVIAASGNVNHDAIVKQSSENFKGVSINYEKNSIPSFPSQRYTGSDIRVRDDAMNCAHVAFALQGPGYSDPDFVAMDIAASLMGNWDLTHGGGSNVSCYMGMVSSADHLAQSFQSFNLKYKNSALWGSYFVGERMKLEELLWQLQYQWKRLCVEVTNNELRQGKNSLLTKLVNQREGSVNNANSLASDILQFGQRISLESWEEKIRRVNSATMRSVAENYIWDRCPAVAAVGPVENLPNYEEIRMKMSWMRY